MENGIEWKFDLIKKFITSIKKYTEKGKLAKRRQTNGGK